MSFELLVTWLMVFLRGVGVVMLLPTINARPIPATVRVAFGAILAGLLYGIVPARPPEPTWMPLLWAGLSELILGFVIGFIARLVFFAVEMAGRLITQHLGLAAAPGIDAPQPSSEPLAAFISVFATVIFFILGGHLGAIAAFARSFDFAPAGLPGYSDAAMEHYIEATGHVLELGFRMAAPFVAMDFLITLAFSVLGRAVPRMNVFIISYPVKMIVGCSLLASSGALLVRYLDPEIADIPVKMLQLVYRTQ